MAAVAAALGAAALALRLCGAGLVAGALAAAVLGAFTAGRGALVAVPDGLGSGETAFLIGTVAGAPREYGERVRIETDVDHADGDPAAFKASLSCRAPCPIESGSHIEVLARLYPPPRPENPGAPPIEHRYARRGVAFTGAFHCEDLRVLRPGPPWAKRAAELRRAFRAQVDAAVSDPRAAALIRALALGDRQGIDRDTIRAYAASGLVHVLSVSGFHLAVVAAGLFGVVRFLLGRSERLLLAVDVRRAAALVALPAVWAYVYLTGAEPPAVRSGIMATLVLLGYVVGRDADGATSLGVAAVVYLAADPGALFDVSFQLSFASVAGLVALARPIASRLSPADPPPESARWRRCVHRGLCGAAVAAAATAAATLPTLPLVAAHFHRIPLTALPANLPALPLASALTVGSALAAVAHAVHPVAALPVLFVAEHLARALDAVARAFAALPWASLPVPAPSPLTVAALAAGAIALARWQGHRRVVAVATAIVLAAGPTAVRVLSRRAFPELTVTFLAVGQGDAAVVRFPGGGTMLVDGGGIAGSDFDPGERIVVPALLEDDVFHIELAVLSHPHPDHAVGLASAIRTLGAGEVWIGAGVRPGRLLRLLAEAAGPTPLRAVDAATPAVDRGGAWVEVLHPPYGGDPGLSVNDASVVLSVRYGRVRFLLPGDIEADGEAAVAARLEPAPVTVLKAPHHGSASSSTETFVRRVAPHHVVFCVGRFNRYGFPRTQVEARYRDAGCVLHRTDRHGAITFRTDGRALAVERFLDPAPEPADAVP